MKDRSEESQQKERTRRALISPHFIVSLLLTSLYTKILNPRTVDHDMALQNARTPVQKHS